MNTSHKDSLRRELIFERDGWYCQLCGGYENLSIDHIVPRNLGGSRRSPNNLWTLCRDCNSKKHSTYPSNLHIIQKELLARMSLGFLTRYFLGREDKARSFRRDELLRLSNKDSYATDSWSG